MIGFSLERTSTKQTVNTQLHEHGVPPATLTRLDSEGRVFSCFLRKGLYKDFPWKTKKIEGDYDASHYIISVKKSESDEYDKALKQPRNQKTPPKRGRKKKREIAAKENPLIPEKLTVIEEYIRVDLYEDIFAQKITTLEKATLSRGKYSMNLIVYEGLKYLGTIQNGSFVGKPLSTWQIYLQGDKSKPKVSIEDFESLESLSIT